jgi:hypothetical protein
MDNKQTTINNKLLKLREWLTIPEATRHLSNILEEEVSESDLLRIALDGHLKLSVYFVNHAYARCGKVVPYEEAEWGESSFSSFLMSGKRIPDKAKGSPQETRKFIDQFPPMKVMKSINLDGERFLNLDEKVITISGVWDLSMVGNERLDVEHEYQNLTDGPAVTLILLDGTFVEREDGVICQVQESFDQNEYQRGSKAQLEKIEERIASNNIGEEQAKKLLDQYKKNREEYRNTRKKKDHSDDYYPAGGLPRDSVIVVRTQALIDLQERLSQDSSKKNISLDSRSETTYLNIIGAMLETFIHRSHGEVDFASEAKLRKFFSQKYAGFKGLTERTLAEKFSAAKKTIREEFD